MSLIRDIGFTVDAMQETVFVTCAALYTTAASTGAYWAFNSTGTAGVDTLISTGSPLIVGGTSTVNGILYGRVIDRLGYPIGANYYVANPLAFIRSTRGSTEADRLIKVGVKLQHGDSSGGGDMADYSTGSTPAVKTYFSTARTTDQVSWETGGRSTGALDASSNPAYYDISGAKQYLRVAILAGKNRVTTESSGDEQARAGATLTFLAADSLPQIVDGTRLSPYSSSTSTV